jgi:hypothetical protein
MKIKTADLTGKALDLAVMMARGFTYSVGMPASEWSADSDCKLAVWRKSPSGVWACMRCHTDDKPSSYWEKGGPIIEREEINLEIHEGGHTRAVFYRSRLPFDGQAKYHHQHGPTPLIAAMRCFVASRYGDTVDVPDALFAEDVS